MANDELITEVLARLERVEQENRQLAAQVETLRGRVQHEPADGRDHDSTDDSAQLARRGLLKRVGGMALGVTAVSAAGQLLNAPTAAASNGEPIIMARPNFAKGVTGYYSETIGAALRVSNSGDGTQGAGIEARGVEIGIHSSGEHRGGVIGCCPNPNDFVKINQAGVGGVGSSGVVGVLGISDTAAGVLGRSAGRIAVHGQCEKNYGYGVGGEGIAEWAVGVGGSSVSNTGVEGYSKYGFGVAGHCGLVPTDGPGAGVYGSLERTSHHESYRSAAVIGDTQDYVGVEGVSDNGDGVVGTSLAARGGVFSGGAAAVRLSPGTGAAAPTAGQTGDLYVDSTGRLWYCTKGGTSATWANLA